MTIVEVCLSGIESALAAQEGGADRIELCENLAEGGTTPSLGMMRAVRERLELAVHVMIRPRGGDFCYSEAEFEVMQQDVALAKQVGVDGLVFGILHPNGTIDKPRCRELIDLIRPLPITFHRAFDLTPDPFAALSDLLELGVERVLTSGQAVTAVSGKTLIRQLQAKAGQQIIIMAGSGITAENAAALLAETGIHEIHAASSCTESLPGKMTIQPPDFSLGTAEDRLQQVTARRVRELALRAKQSYVSDNTS